MPLADTLLRMAEDPRLYSPKWSRTILDEVTRNLVAKWDMPVAKARRREAAIRLHFPEALVEGDGPLIPEMTNDPGDRHVLAAASVSQCGAIVTYNRRHFPPASLDPLGIEAIGPSEFLCRLYDLDPTSFVGKLHDQAAAIEAPLDRLLGSLAKNAPSFVDFFTARRLTAVRARIAGVSGTASLGQEPQSVVDWG